MLSYNLENLIKLLDTNQSKLSALSDVRPNTIADLSKGNAKRIEVDTLDGLLDALNGLAKSKGIKHYFQVQDIIQYHNDLYKDNEDHYGELVNKEEFEMLRSILSKEPITTSTPGIETTTLTKLLILYREKITAGIVYLSREDLTPIDRIFIDNFKLREYFLMDFVHDSPTHSKFRLKEKGIEFVKLLRKYGSS
jgi:DNA-binding Xre family transcriptional regulator